jgi:glycosyltransferase involved in cell wall biosynthesis
VLYPVQLFLQFSVFIKVPSVVCGTLISIEILDTDMINITTQAHGAHAGFAGVAVLLPAYNEELAVAETVRGFLQALPGCTVIVCDNCSTDATAELARQSGAVVIHEPLRGKGNAVRRLLNSVDADIYVMADADTTYDPLAAVEMIALMKRDHLDLVTGVRQHTDPSAYRRGHVIGNSMFNKLFEGLFQVRTADVFSGYRIISGRFARALCVQSSGFEVETELTAIAAVLKLSVAERPVKYSARPEGSSSKLKTYSDGFRILKTYFLLLQHFHPSRFYGFFAILFALTSLGLGFPVVTEFFHTGLVPRFPTAILASSIGLIAVIFFVLSILLDILAKIRLEQRQLVLRSYRP